MATTGYGNALLWHYPTMASELKGTTSEAIDGLGREERENR